MNNDELAALLTRKGLDNTIEIKGEDLHRLLALQQPYDFLMQFVKELASIGYTEEQFREEQAEVAMQFKDVAERKYDMSCPIKVTSAFLRVWQTCDKAASLRMVYPPASWEPDRPPGG